MAKCGTDAGYAVHYRAGQDPCEPCREARREYQRTLDNARHQRYADRGRRIIDTWKQAQGCAHCGYDENPLGMEIDHIIPLSKGGGGVAGTRLYNFSSARLMEELQHPNVQVLCGTCHNIKSAMERRNG